MSKQTILVYSDDSSTRAAITNALGNSLAHDLPDNEILEFATAPALRAYVDSKGSVDLFILDGESAPEGGMGVARQLKDEVFNCAPVLVITGRKEDSWLAAWSMADASIVHPIDPFTLAKSAAGLLRQSPSITA